ncbi:MAG: FAD-dependent oxidoreductase, partial [Deltaproteobacteria bacterium]|nr:FAD-dependent oxidoreductase [Deltaproteobacteria bacterium]
IESVKGSEGLLIPYVNEDGSLAQEYFDMAVLSVGMETPPETVDLARNLDINLTEGQFCDTGSFHPVTSSIDGIYVCGAFQGPKDIPQSVIEAGSAAAESGALLHEARYTLTVEKEPPAEIDISGQRPRVGVFVCQCGINISAVVDIEAVRDYAATLPYVEFVMDNLYTCSQDTQEAMTRVIREKKLNRIVVAACTPKTHEPLFQETLVNAGINKYLVEMTNIRNQDSWVHKGEPSRATDKAMDLIRMAVVKVALTEPLTESEVKINKSALVIGGGIAGIAAARNLSGQGYRTHLVERGSVLGGQALNLFRTWKGENVRENLSEMIRDVESDNNISVYLDSELTESEGFVGNFNTTVETRGDRKQIEHGVTIIATGAHEFRPEEYLLDEDERVITHLDLDKKFMEQDPALKEIKTAVFIQCVGSREPERPYCSRLCCTHSIESALHLKEINPDMQVYILFRDIRTYGEREYLYRKARLAGIIFIRISPDSKPVVSSGEDGLIIKAVDTVLGDKISIRSDLLVLATAIIPNRDEKIAQMFKLPVNEDGFFIEAHAKLGPSEFAVDGVFLCGMTHYPKSIDESISQALAAASRAVTLLSRDTITTSGVVAAVKREICSSCGICVDICPYSAVSMDEKAEVNPILCKGCGLCVASCRSGAVNLKGFGENQIMAMINEV